MIYTNQALNLIIVSIIDVRDPDEAEIGSNPDCLWLHVLPNSYLFFFKRCELYLFRFPARILRVSNIEIITFLAVLEVDGAVGFTPPFRL